MDAETQAAIRLVYEASREVLAQADRQLDLAERLVKVASALDDLLPADVVPLRRAVTDACEVGP